MKKIGIIIFIGALVFGVVLANFFSFGNSFVKSPISFSFGKVRGSGNIVTDKRDVSEFKNIDVSGIFKVEITAQKDFGLEVEADDNLLEFIKTEVNGETLKIEKRKGFKSTKSVVIRVSAPNIEKLEASGVTKTSISDINNEELKIDVSGASRVSIAGTTKNLEIDMSGASKINAEDLAAENAKIDGSGASKAIIEVSKVLTAELSGASRATYSGNPSEIKKRTSGASRLRQK